jgi:hypothetical protein
VRRTAASLKKAQERVKELEHDAMAAEKERVRLAAAVEAQTAATRLVSFAFLQRQTRLSTNRSLCWFSSIPT